MAQLQTTGVTGSLNLTTGNAYQIAGTSVLSGNTLGSGILNSSLTSVGTLASLLVTGNVGIGTTSAKTRLQASSGIQGSSPSAAGTATTSSVYFSNSDTAYGILMGVLTSGNGWIQAQRTDGTATTYALLLNPNGGAVSVGPALTDGLFNVNGGSLRVYLNGSDSVSPHLYIANAANNRAYNFQPNASGNAMALWAYNGSSWNNILVVSASGEVGIGTASPAQVLDVIGSGQFTGNLIPATDNTGAVGTAANTWANGQFTNLTVDSTLTVTSTLNVRAAIDLADNDILRLGSSDDWEFFHNATDNYMDLNVGNLYIRDNTTTRWTFERTTGNVGIGTTNPTGSLHIQSATPTLNITSTTTTGTTIGNKGNRVLLLSDSSTVGNGGELVFASLDTNTERWAAISGHIRSNSVGGSVGDIVFATKTTDAATALTATMYIQYDGLVGIGTTGPTAKLHIGPQQGDTTPHIYLASGNNAYGWVIDTHDSTGGVVDFRIFRKVNNVNTRALTIANATGYVGIDTTNPQALLDVTGTARARTLFVNNVSGNSGNIILQSGSSNAFWISAKADAAGAGSLHIGANGGTEPTSGVLVIDTNSNVGIGTTVMNARLQVDGSIFASSSAATIRVEKTAHAAGADNFHAELYSPQGSTTGEISLRFHQSNRFYSQIRVRAGGAFRFTEGGNDNLVDIFANNMYSVGSIGVNTTSFHDGAKLDVRTGKIVAGSAGGSTGGSVTIQDYYSDGALAVWGAMYSSAGAMMGHAVRPSTNSATGFFSSTGITAARGAYIIEGNTHRWYNGAAQTVAIGGAVTTTERMTLSGDGNLGIGTSAAHGKLTVQGGSLYLSTTDDFSPSTNVGSGLIIARGAATGNTYSSIYGVQAGGSSYANLVVPGGNLGIGTTSPAYKLDVVGGGTANTGLVIADFKNSAASSRLQILDEVGATSLPGGIASATGFGLGLYATAAAPVIIYTSGTNPRLTVTSGGLVGVGANAAYVDSNDRFVVAGGRLAVNASAYTATSFNRSTNGTISEFLVGGTGRGGIAWDGSFFNFISYSAMKLMTNTTTNAVTINSDGDVGIGTTSMTVKLQMQGSYTGYTDPGNSKLPGIYLYNTDNANSASHAYLALRTGGGSGGDPFISFDISGVTGWSMGIDNSDSDRFIISSQWNGLGSNNELRLDSSGNLVVAGDVTAYGTPSDISFKTNIQPLTNSLSAILQLRGVTFDWKEDSDPYEMTNIKEDIGFIAQEVQQVIPKIVRENENGKLSIRDRALVPLLVEAIKELKADNDELRSLIIELQKK